MIICHTLVCGDRYWPCFVRLCLCQWLSECMYLKNRTSVFSATITWDTEFQRLQSLFDQVKQYQAGRQEFSDKCDIISVTHLGWLTEHNDILDRFVGFQRISPPTSHIELEPNCHSTFKVALYDIIDGYYSPSLAPSVTKKCLVFTMLKSWIAFVVYTFLTNLSIDLCRRLVG